MAINGTTQTTTDASSGTAPFSIGEARAIVKDLFRPNMSIYWADFLGTMTVGFICFSLVRNIHRLVSLPALAYALSGLFFLVASLAYYRAAIFNHELVHLRGDRYRAFRVAWNLLCGIPFLMPSFTYYTHVRHHMRKMYATPLDGEYLSLRRGPRWKILLFLGESFVVPFLAVFRFLVLAPLSLISQRIRKFAQQRASSMVIDPLFVRPLPTRTEWRIWKIQELATSLYVWAVAILVATGLVPWQLLVLAYCTGVTVLLINSLRTLGAHNYYHEREEVSFLDQLLDSVNYPRNLWLAELWAPLGLRYHALHHLFPSMPYHHLGTAHERLMERLPANSAYRQTVRPTLTSALWELWRDASSPEASTPTTEAASAKPSPAYPLKGPKRPSRKDRRPMATGH